MTKQLAVWVNGGLATLALVLGQVALSTAQAAFTQQGSTLLPGVALNARSASLADYDDDGDLDVFFQGIGNIGDVNGAQRLFRNNFVGTGALSFTNVTSALLPTTSIGSSWSSAWGDYNGDGRIDVFIGQTNQGTSGSGLNAGDLLMNNGAAGFVNTSVATGLNDPGFDQNLAWVDIDNDRDLDLLFGMEGPERHEIYLQGPAAHFTKVGAAVGFQQSWGTKGYGMAVGDTDGDGDLDVYISVCNPFPDLRNNFYKNMLVETGSLSFVDIADSNGTQNYPNSYGSEFLDMDDDGDLDLVMTGADRTPSKIFRNDGGNMFTDVDTLTGRPLLSSTGGDLNGSRAVDYDNDGDLDLFFHDNTGSSSVNNARKLYRNDGNWEFTDVTVSEGLFEGSLGAYDSPWGDLDRDGDLDLIGVTDLRGGIFDPRAAERVFINDASTNGNHWLFVRLEGPSDNTTGIGASIYATINAGTPEERTLRREANTNAGTFNQSDLPVHFGLGAAALIDELAIHWPDGTVQVLNNVATNQYLTVRTPGDFNGDGQVTGADLADWQGDFGASGSSDTDYDGDADGQDFLAWQRQLGNGVLASGSIVETPEPTAAALALAALVLGCGARKRVALTARRK